MPSFPCHFFAMASMEGHHTLDRNLPLPEKVTSIKKIRTLAIHEARLPLPSLIILEFWTKIIPPIRKGVMKKEGSYREIFK